MAWVAKHMGKYMSFNPKSPEAAGVCDYTGFVFPHSKLKKQMDWRGNSLVWTGLMVGEPFLDKPQPQNRPPPIKSDPTVVENPRLPQNYRGLQGSTQTYAQIFKELSDTRQNQPVR